jgi:hypothetical protein
MGMTIDEAIVWLNTDDFESKGFADATSVAIDTIRRYQKIEQIIKDHDADNMPEDYWYIDRIREVVDDGNDDWGLGK